MRKILLSIVMLIISFSAQSQDVVSTADNSDGTYNLGKKILLDDSKSQCLACYKIDINNTLIDTTRESKRQRYSHDFSCAITQQTNTHVLRIGVGSYRNGVVFSEGTDDIIVDEKLYRNVRSFNIEYSYCVAEIFEIGVNVTYKNVDSRGRSAINNSIVWSHNDHRLAIAPVIRAFWVKQKYFKLYTASSIGLLFEYEVHEDSYYSWTFGNTTLATQITFLGASIGNKLFAYGELGIGTQGVFMGGIGYRF